MTKTPRQRRKAKNQAAILDAATRLIVSQGFENVSLREIAKKADYSPAGLYKHFSSKAAIIHAVLARDNRRLIEFLAAVPSDLTPADRLIKLCLGYIQFSLANPAFLTLVNNLPSGRASKDQPVPPNSPYLLFLQAVQTWVAAEGIALEDAYGTEEITYALWAMIQGMATLRLNQLRGFEADFDAVNRRTLECYLNGLRPGGSI